MLPNITDQKVKNEVVPYVVPVVPKCSRTMKNPTR